MLRDQDIKRQLINVSPPHFCFCNCHAIKKFEQVFPAI
jgi:hypothetical protein